MKKTGVAPESVKSGEPGSTFNRSDLEREQKLVFDLFGCIGSAGDLPELVHKLTDLVAQWTGCEAIGIRLQDGEDFPYFETRGFPLEFVLAENSLCRTDADGELIRDKDHNPVIACMCGNVICGRFDSNKPFFSKNGSFWTNCTTQLLASTSEEDRQSRTRDRCNGEGYESVALIPLGMGENNFGLLQVNDKRKDRFTLPMISSLERVATYMSVIISRQKAVDESRLAEMNYRTVADFTYDWEIWRDPDGRFKYVSPSCERISGFSADEFQKSPDLFRQIIVVEDLPIWYEHCRIAEGKAGAQGVQFRIKRRDGEVVWIEHGCQPVTDSEGHFLGFRSSNRDITDRKRMEEELVKKDKLETVGILAGGLAHDFNNILGGVLGNISLAMADVEPNTELFHTLAAAEKATIRAASLTQRLLTFSKGGAPIKEMAKVADIIKESAEFVMSGSNVHGRYSFADNQMMVEADKGQLSQVIQNLALNACQAMPEGGVLDIVAEHCSIPPANELGLPSGSYLKVSFADTGEGIPAEIIDKIFDPFFSTKPKGSGLGLATAYSIVRKHGGHIGVESSVGQGTTFVIHLPASSRSEPGTVEHEELAVPSTGGTDTGLSGRILIMDDDATIREVATRILARVGLAVDCAVNTPQTVAMYKEAMDVGRPYDLVILDLTIRGENGGKKTVKILQDIEPEVKAIVYSGYADDPVISDYEKYGFCCAVAKPFRPHELIEAVHQALAAKQ